MKRKITPESEPGGELKRPKDTSSDPEMNSELPQSSNMPSTSSAKQGMSSARVQQMFEHNTEITDDMYKIPTGRAY